MTDVTQFVTSALAGHKRVLEVGCGRGELARELATRGFAVTALDVQLRDVVEAPGVTFVEREFLAYEAAPFDAVVFTLSLHHIAPLSDAIARAAALVKPGGMLCADEFDLAAPDATTLRWYYDTQELLVATGCFDADRLDEDHDDVIERWQRAHRHDHHHPLHTGTEMIAAIAARFELIQTQRLEYLCRYIAGGVAAHLAGPVGVRLREIERRLIANKSVVPVGLRLVAVRSA